ncbi:MAG: esterase-like activity of phytase family protein [Candidatus Polarisedimenticolia bacterium]
MSPKLELVREAKLERLLPGRRSRAPLEASGVALLDDQTALVVFDNLNRVARIDLSLEWRGANRFFMTPSLGSGFEDIAVDRKGKRVFCLVEALEDVDGQFRGFVAEYDAAQRFIACTPLSTRLVSENKGLEGLAHVRLRGREYLFALCEGNLGTEAKRGGARIDAFTRAKGGGWERSHRVRLPRSAEFEDYAAISYRDERLALLSQASKRVWVAQVDERARVIVRGSEAVYRFPGKAYGNVEGIAWLSHDTLVAVSDRKKPGQPERCSRKDQSIHLFRIPAGPG